MCACGGGWPPTSPLTRTRACVRAQISASKKRTGMVSPKKFVQRLKRDNELFNSYMHQVRRRGRRRMRASGDNQL